MTRMRRHGTELTVELEIALTIGPMPLLDDFTEEDLEIAWRIHGAAIMSGSERRHGSRPGAWWIFDKGSEPPPMEPGAKELRLAELGELSEQEREDLAKRAAEARQRIEGGNFNYVATGGGKRTRDFEREHVEIHEAVERVAEER
jgi:hypothetical protein